MSGSFTPFCIIVFVASLSLVLFRKESFGMETIRFLRFIQAAALSGALSEPLTEFFGGSMMKGVALSICIGAILFLLLTRQSSRFCITTRFLHGNRE